MNDEDHPFDAVDDTLPDHIDPRLVERALKRMRGLVRGNGVDVDAVALGADLDILRYRFPARVEIKLDPQYGIRVEPGRNVQAELATSVEDFQKKIQTAISAVRADPVKRQQIIDFVFSRSDKGFGISSQRVKFKSLAFDLVRHEQCQSCSHSGYSACPRCHGKGVEVCVQCRGHHQMRCPKCHGSTQIQTAKGSVSCDFCRGSGQTACTMCGARGQIKCRGCGASGKIACKSCSGTGWLSHLAHVDIDGIIQFDFEKENLPARLVSLIEQKGSFLVAKGDVEVELISHHPVSLIEQKGHVDDSLRKESDNVVRIDYMATCPYGSIHFTVGSKTIPAILLGWQARLIDAPAFLEDMTRPGIDAIKKAGTDSRSAVLLLRNAARYAVWREMISHMLVSGNLKKNMAIIMNRYSTGLDAKTVRELIISCDRAVRSVTRTARYIGLGIGMVLFSFLGSGYFIGDWRGSLSENPLLLLMGDVLLLFVGMGLGIFGSQIFAMMSQKRAFSGIVADDVLKKKLPRVGHSWVWGLGCAALIIGAILGYMVAQDMALPEWLSRLMPA